MKTRHFYLNIDQDKILMASIEFDEQTAVTIDPLVSNMFNSLSLGPSVLDVSSLNYIPQVGDVWDGNNFIGDHGVSDKIRPEIDGDFSAFSFVIGKTHSFYYVYPGTEETNMLVAILKSNPTITFEDTDD